ncbi:MAG: phosphohydrolase [Treponema sp.]|nr:phosphohydrolase [Treponema sp.]
MNNLIRIDASDIKLGISFSSPVFFDDGKNMFLAEGKTVKNYHLNAIKKWKLPFLLTYGRELTAEEAADLSNKPAVDNKPVQDSVNTQDSANTQNAEVLEDLETLEEVEELEEI